MLTSSNTANTSQNKTFTYNLLNLPQKVTVATGTSTFTYDAAGNKLRKVAALGSTTITTDYVGGIQYRNSLIDFIQTEEGKIAYNKTTGVYDYEYYLGDNLGNTRVTFNIQNGVATALQRDDYMPFGYEISNGSPANPKNEYLYNKKELQEELTQYDYGARFYDPLIGRWNTIDPLAENFLPFSTYNYCLNNPIKYIDPTGMRVIDADSIVAKMKQTINQQMEVINSLVAKGTVTQEFAKGYLGVLKSTLSDINTLENSDITYNVYNDPSGITAAGQGETRYNTTTKNVDIAFGVGVRSNDIYLQSHELVHGVQFDSGQLSLLTTGHGGAGSLTDITDEVAANNRQESLGAGLMGFAARTIYTDETLRQKVFPDGQRYYQSLKSGPIDINSSEGRALRAKTVMEGISGQPQSEVYKKSTDDYNLGKALHNFKLYR